ncbi:hypothetical protein K2173_016794 [Erythroxylum novogranatense]|uniref:Uncharacterized protein n=1 Tax=Erythroxylum novogranatense TaxID=1862640 RepID=A0AAV8SH25_9ROSI|nr:hypothetical protein K2173_016794 [Erythroxylum novogranatense]
MYRRDYVGPKKSRKDKYCIKKQTAGACDHCGCDCGCHPTCLSICCLSIPESDLEIIKNVEFEELQEFVSGTHGTVYHEKGIEQLPFWKIIEQEPFE